jgi:hypothetical protein
LEESIAQQMSVSHGSQQDTIQRHQNAFAFAVGIDNFPACSAQTELYVIVVR